MIANSLNVDDNVGRKCFDQDALEKGDHRPKWRADSAIWKALFAAIVQLYALAALTTDAAAGTPAEIAWRVFMEPTFMHPAASGPLAKAKRTVLAAGFLGEFGLETFSKADVEGLHLPWPDFVKRALVNADADVDQLAISYTRNKKKVIEYAEVRSKDGLIVTAVLAPKFLTLFQDTLGPSILVAVPNRELAYAFPKLAGHVEDYGQAVLTAYRESTHPVTLEIFEIDATGIKAVGLYPDPAHD